LPPRQQKALSAAVVSAEIAAGLQRFLTDVKNLLELHYFSS
jgi:hypothetical protein